MGKDILRYEDFIIQDHYKWVDSLIVNESIGDDISGYLRKVFQKIKNLSIDKKKTILIYALSSLLIFTNADKILYVINNDNFIKSELFSTPELKEIVEEKIEESPFKDATEMRLSQDGWDQIKAEEGDPKNPGEPVLTAYKIGDGMITVGWGHAEKIKDSKYRVGQKITREEAKLLLRKDVTYAADGVRRIFKDWKEKGIERKITQDQFDALVSMAFNMGVGGLRRSDVIQHIKKGDYKTAGESIKRQNLNPKFGGLKTRREREASLFLSYLKSSSVDKMDV